jgi:ring-1,2-phenylacetyl-CoA epoxidase subunit PaaD
MSQPALKPNSAAPVPDEVVQALESVVDPEIPVLTIRDLGVLRGVRMEGACVVVTITPTYSGCPAMVEIRENINKALGETGIGNFRVETQLAPAWTTDWMSEEGKRKLLEYGIAPPGPVDPGQAYSAFRDDGQGDSRFRDDRQGDSRFRDDRQGDSRFRDDGGSNEAHVTPEIAQRLSGAYTHVPCPQCGSENTSLISEFGSTACKALYRCNDCFEPFDHFKCH